MSICQQNNITAPANFSWFTYYFKRIINTLFNSRKKECFITTYAFDLDGTIFSLKYALHILNRELDQNLKIKDLHTYDLAENFNVSKQTIHDIYVKYGTEIATNSTPNQHLADAINRWHSQGIATIAVTARPSGLLTPEIYHANQQVLKDNNIPIDYLVMKDDDKLDTLLKLNVDRFFDDKPSLIETMFKSKLHQTCELTLIDAPYNQACPCDSRFYLY